uniref:hypothetical protein n=1 Tax=Staphylococcus epidermidis TaxID=1282 RepID=UPI00066AD6DB
PNAIGKTLTSDLPNRTCFTIKSHLLYLKYLNILYPNHNLFIHVNYLLEASILTLKSLYALM